MARSTSGTYSSLDFPLSELFLEALGIGAEVFGPAIQRIHMVEARRSANIMLQGRWSNRGLNLWATGDEQLCIPLQPNVKTYLCPPETLVIADSYLRTYTPSTDYTTLGNTLTGFGPPPTVSQTYGDVLVLAPGSGTLSCTAGNQYAQLHWPSHGLENGEPLFWGCPVIIGGQTLYNFSIVDHVLDVDTVEFILPALALETQVLQGGTRLFYTTLASPNVKCISPGHGLSVGDTFPVPIATSVGGFTLSGSYTVLSIQSSYEFTFQPTGGNATSAAQAFENGGQINVAVQHESVDPTDIYLYPLSRNDYAMLPDKNDSGSPTQYWFNRTRVPQIVVWPRPQTVTQGQPPFFGFIAYRMRAVQDANPVSGQTLDAPARLYSAFCGELAATMALKFKMEKFAVMKALAMEAWEEASNEDRERVSSYLMPDFSAYT